jgi:hypothetical protein
VCWSREGAKRTNELALGQVHIAGREPDEVAGEHRGGGSSTAPALWKVKNLLERIGEGELARRLLDDLADGRVRLRPLEGAGVRAETAPWIWSGPNHMTLDQTLLENQIPDRAANDAPNVIAWALTVRHEYEHMGQTNPDQKPEFEDPAWQETIATGARWYTRLAAELERVRQRPASPDKVEDLRELRRLMSGVASSLVDSYQNLQGGEGEIAAGHVTAGLTWPGLNGPSRDLSMGTLVVPSAVPAQPGPIDNFGGSFAPTGGEFCMPTVKRGSFEVRTP